MADTLQLGLTEFRDLLYTTNPTDLKSMQGFSFNRDEFIFTMIDKKTKIIIKSKTLISIRVLNLEMIDMKDAAGIWSFLRYDETVLVDTDPEMVWLKSNLDSLIDSISLIQENDSKIHEYSSFLDRITDGLI